MDIKLFKTKNNFKKKRSEPNPDLYWRIVLAVAFLLLILSVVWGFSLFTKINKDPETPLAGVNEQLEKLKKERINKVLDYFFGRAVKSEEIIKSSSPVIDPSV